jgi:hypothetical protein
MKGRGLVFLMLGVSFLVASCPAGGWVSGTGAVEVSRSVVDRMNEFEYYNIMRGDGSLDMGPSAKGGSNLERGVSPGTFSLSYSGDVPLVGMKRIDKGSALAGTKTTIQESFSAHEIEKEETTSLGTQLVGTDTKLSFNGTYVTTSNRHQIFTSDVTSRQVFSGTFDIQKQIIFGSITDLSPSITIAVSPTESSAVVGGVVTRYYEVANVGPVPVQGLVLVDSRAGPVPLSKVVLNPGEVATAESSFVVNLEDLPGPLNDAVRATGSDLQGNAAVASAAANTSLAGSRGLNLTAIPLQGCAGAGEALAFIYIIENVGDRPVGGLNLTDSFGGPFAVYGTIMPDGTLNLTRDGTLPDTEIYAPLTITVSISGIDSTDDLVYASSAVVLRPC